ncbi:MAG: hypothetical protein A2W93_06400 [Bacteroidetes bacterium GWF2_43_63]|nr:MAG: hypothetical protein A2W94_08135 [Bacteroidetes bacterium GWE2_42_42]OFY53251.1 MAG: hypothetical protein A2W93_06400 [Bacteroidetes bacterium GWF2_43_63]HBG71757.1 hypothetical protein [Bacteroidales bacterium]HCB61578.1 hypothetical protein [Bacteroidales bacterium]HCY22790.1 hypothetical protein [Bacteroidales bacterium]
MQRFHFWIEHHTNFYTDNRLFPDYLCIFWYLPAILSELYLQSIQTEWRLLSKCIHFEWKLCISTTQKTSGTELLQCRMKEFENYIKIRNVYIVELV